MNLTLNALEIESLSDSELLHDLKNFNISSISQPTSKNRKWNSLLTYELMVTNKETLKTIYRMKIHKFNNGKEYFADDIQILDSEKVWCMSFDDLDRSNGWKIIEAINRGLVTFNYQEKAI